VDRSGTHPTSVKGLYVTGDFAADSDGIEFRHTNGTQGIGFGYNTIYATGGNANQDLGLKPKGTGKVNVTGTLLVSQTLSTSPRSGGIAFPADAFGGSEDAAWIRYSRRGDSGEACTLEIGVSNDADDHIILTTAGNVGIGTTSPSKGKVHIEGSVNFQDPRGYRYLNRPEFNSTTPGATAPYSLYANGFIGAPEFNAFSDTRIKEVQGVSNSKSDLETLLQINITDYTYKDKFANDSRFHKKVLGQQIAEVFPQAVRTHTDVVPDIFQPASIDNGWVSLAAHGLQTGERVRFLLEGSEPQICTVEASTPESFLVSLAYEGEIFVYGREVNDFHVVDYDALAMLHISATQELCKVIDILKLEVQQLKAQRNSS
jgi:hypothetical protein